MTDTVGGQGRKAAVLRAIPPAARIYVEGGTGHPLAVIPLLLQLAAKAGPFEIVTSISGPAPAYCLPEHSAHFRVKSFRGTAEVRAGIISGQVDVVPAHLSAIPRLLHGPLRPDVAIVQVSPPDRRGWCSLGASVLYHRSAMEAASVVIGEVNPQMPRTLGDALVHQSTFDHLVDGDHELVTEDPVSPSDREMEVARRVVEFVPDGSTIQVGMGRFATAVLRALAHRRDLRIHAGLLSDGIMDLAASGALTNCAGAVVSGGFIGSPQLYEFLDQNPLVMMRRTEYTHDPGVMRAAPYFVSINSALEIDLTGQSNAESIKGMPISGSGGALDFMRGASGAGGLAILGLTASSKDRGRSRIVPELNSPVVVTAPRTDVDVVVTEFGAVDLRGMGLREREGALQAISDPSAPPLREP